MKRPRAMIVVAAILAAVGCGSPRPTDGTTSGEVVDEGSTRSFEATLAPGTWYVINYVSFVRAGTIAEMVADFTTSERTSLLPIAFSHPRADVTVGEAREGHQPVEIHCPGLANHPLKIAVSKQASEGTLVARSDETGLFGIAFRNDGPGMVELRITLRAVRSTVMVMTTTPMPGDTFHLRPTPPAGEDNPLRPARAGTIVPTS